MHVGQARTAAQGDFARGQRRDIRRGYLYGDFATGTRRLGIPHATGDFATGMRLAIKLATVGDFASGMRTLTTPVAIHHLPRTEHALPAAA